MDYKNFASTWLKFAGIQSIPEICVHLFDDAEFTDADRLAEKGYLGDFNPAWTFRKIRDR